MVTGMVWPAHCHLGFWEATRAGEHRPGFWSGVKKESRRKTFHLRDNALKRVWDLGVNKGGCKTFDLGTWSQNSFTISITINCYNIINSSQGNLPSSCIKQTNALNKQTNDLKYMRVSMPLDKMYINAAMEPSTKHPRWSVQSTYVPETSCVLNWQMEKSGEIQGWGGRRVPD